MRIMIVENEALVAEDIKEILAGAGHTVVGIATTQKEAVKLAKDEVPDLAILDVGLANGENGLDVAERLGSVFHLSIIFLTGRTDFHVRAMALPVQPVAFVSKPFQPDDLLEAVHQAG